MDTRHFSHVLSHFLFSLRSTLLWFIQFRFIHTSVLLWKTPSRPAFVAKYVHRRFGLSLLLPYKFTPDPPVPFASHHSGAFHLSKWICILLVAYSTSSFTPLPPSLSIALHLLLFHSFFGVSFPFLVLFSLVFTYFLIVFSTRVPLVTLHPMPQPSSYPSSSSCPFTCAFHLFLLCCLCWFLHLIPSTSLAHQLFEESAFIPFPFPVTMRKCFYFFAFGESFVNLWWPFFCLWNFHKNKQTDALKIKTKPNQWYVKDDHFFSNDKTNKGMNKGLIYK